MAIIAVVALTSIGWAGTALAADDPSDVVGSVAGAAGSATGSSSASDGASSGSSSSTSAPEVKTTEEDSPSASPRALLGTSALAFPTAFPTFPTGTNIPTIPGLPTFDPGTDPVTACSQVVSTLSGLDPTQLSSALNAPAAIFCSALGFTLPSLPGDQSATGVTETVYAPPDFYDDGYGRRYYSSCGCKNSDDSTSTATPVAATQVSSVPTGGVNTGDGSYEGP